ncbi:helix-turn-helix transcriptional regulator [Thermodesulfobacteriota bacterium]
MPYLKISLKAPKPLRGAYPKSLKTLGNHIRKKRIDLKLSQKAVSKIIGVQEETIWTWESNLFSPNLRCIPKIIDFLGYIPKNAPIFKSIKNRITLYRTLRGITQRELAKEVGVNESTIIKWEKGKGWPTIEMKTRLKDFFDEL